VRFPHNSTSSCKTIALNIRADILSNKDQVNTKEDNKDIKMLKDKL